MQQRALVVRRPARTAGAAAQLTFNSRRNCSQASCVPACFFPPHRPRHGSSLQPHYSPIHHPHPCSPAPNQCMGTSRAPPRRRQVARPPTAAPHCVVLGAGHARALSSSIDPIACYVFTKCASLLAALPDNTITGSSSRTSPRESFGDGADDDVGGRAAAAGSSLRRLHRLQECRLLLLRHAERSTCYAASNMPKRRLHSALTAAIKHYQRKEMLSPQTAAAPAGPQVGASHGLGRWFVVGAATETAAEAACAWRTGGVSASRGPRAHLTRNLRHLCRRLRCRAAAAAPRASAFGTAAAAARCLQLYFAVGN